ARLPDGRRRRGDGGTARRALGGRDQGGAGADRRGRRVSGVVTGDDGRLRCPWALSAPEFLDYHDREWGRPLATDQAMFERLSLEAFQSGLSWLVILRKRDGFRAAFDGFDLKTVAGYDGHDVERLLADAGIVRNRAKIEAAI